jgi:hypothetical protein
VGEILALGLMHHPALIGQDERMVGALRYVLKQSALPEEYRTPAGWPEPMRREWGADEGLTAARQHRAEIVGHLRKLRAALDDFQPDFLLIWGDDQYENFRDDAMPAYCLLGYEATEVRPWADGEWEKIFGRNLWGEPADQAFVVPGHRAAAKALTTGLLAEGFEVAYAYRPLHHPGLSHPYLNAFLYLDYDRQGWSYPVVPMHVNCYGRLVISQRAGLPRLDDPITGDRLDPPSPMPWRCFDLGTATARVLARGPWRVALVASSSWSHAFLTAKHHYLYPDVEADRRLFAALQRGDWAEWRERPLSAIEESGQQEMLNWLCLAGALAELGRRPDYAALLETHIFNSDKAFVISCP